MPVHEPASSWLKKPFKRCALIGAGVLLVSVALMASFPRHAPKLPQGFFTPIMAFEFIQEKQEIEDLFGRPDSPLRAEIVRRMDLGNTIDYVFMVLYCAFLFCLGVEAFRATGARRFLLACPAAALVLAGDVIENLQLMRITRGLASGGIESPLALLRVFTWVKWGGIVAAFLILLPFVLCAGRLGKACAFFMLVSAALGGAAFFFQLCAI